MKSRIIRPAGTPALPGRFLKRLKPISIAVQIGIAVALTLPGAVTAHAQTSVSSAMDIPAGPLAETLNLFALQKGVSIVVDAESLKGLNSEGLQGAYDVETGFGTLLRNSGYRIGKTASGYVLIAAPDSQSSEREAPVLSEVLVTGKHESAGTTTVDRKVINAMSAGNGDITSLLRVLPNVQFDDSQLKTGRQGEIAPADISINGAKYYQNLYQLDGMTINNDIDPVNDNPNNMSSPPSASQGFAIDSSLICKVTVRDSNVPAEFGGFSGGVVSADTCAPTRDFGGRVSVGTTRSSWMKHKIAPQQEGTYANSTDQDTARKFDKWTYKLALEGKPTENLGLIGSFIRRTATIPLNAYGNGSISGGDNNRKEETRLNDNWFAKAFWAPTLDTDVDLSVQYMPGHDEHFIANAKDSFFTLDSGGLGINGGISTRFDRFTLSHRLSTTKMESSRDSDSSIWKLWRFSEAGKNWGVPSSPTSTQWNSGEGGYGNVDQTQETLNYQFKSDFSPFAILASEHRFQAGIELTRKEFSYHRKTSYEQYQAASEYTGADCIRADGSIDPWCSTADTVATGATAALRAWDGQYLRQRIIHKAGKFDVSDNSRAIFVQDAIRLGKWSALLGLRYDSSDLAPESTLAPRSSVSWDVFGNGTTRLEAGANRYYGRNFMAYYMHANRLSLQSGAQTRTGLVDWAAPVFGATASMYNTQNLDVPYDDEGMLAARQQLGNAMLGLKYVKRKSKDQVVLHLRGVGDYWYDNIGQGEADNWGLTLETLRPLSLWGTNTSIMAGMDHTKVKTTHIDYTNTVNFLYGENPLDQQIIYQGKVMRAMDKPADNYSRPWSARLLFMTEIPAANLSIGNFFRFRDGFRKIVNTNTSVTIDGQRYQIYDQRKFSSAFTWDMRLNWEIPASIMTSRPYLSLTVDNVLNQTNIAENTGDYMIYEKGRQFWLEFGLNL